MASKKASLLPTDRSGTQHFLTQRPLLSTFFTFAEPTAGSWSDSSDSGLAKDACLQLRYELTPGLRKDDYWPQWNTELRPDLSGRAIVEGLKLTKIVCTEFGITAWAALAELRRREALFRLTKS
jgi:hypothetical protein